MYDHRSPIWIHYLSILLMSPSNSSHRDEVSRLKNEHQEKKDELDQTLDMEMNTVCYISVVSAYVVSDLILFIETIFFFISSRPNL